jgi:MFS family permease
MTFIAPMHTSRTLPPPRASQHGTANGVALAATVGNMVGITPAVSATFGVFLIPIATDFGWSRALVSGVLGLISIISALIYPFVGYALDRFGARLILIGGNIFFGTSIILLALATSNVVLFYLLFGLVGIAGSIPSTAMFCKVVSNWFDERRGLMLGVSAGLGNGLGATIMPIAAGLMLAPFGWRGAFVGIGLIVILLGAPILLLFLRDAPAGRPAAGAIDALEGMSLSQAWRTLPFWLLLIGVGAGAGGMTAVFTHVVPMLTDHHVDLGQATIVIAVFALVTAAWQIGAGHLLDKYRTPRLITPMYGAAILGLVLLQFGHGTISNMSAGVLLGIGLGAEYAALPYFISRYFGLRHYGSITGVIYAVVILVQGITPALMDLGFDHLGSYDVATIVIIAALAIAMILFALLPRPTT